MEMEILKKDKDIYRIIYNPAGAELKESDLKDISQLLAQLSDKSPQLCLKDLEEILSQPYFYLLIVRHRNKIVAMASILHLRTLSKNFAIIEDVVVDKEHRNRGIGKALLEKIISWARHKKLSHIDLTSQPHRQIANKLYQKLGFIKRETNCYRLIL